MIDLKSVKRVVVKIGSSLVSGEKGLNRGFFSRLAAEAAFLRERGVQLVVVTSGAIAAAMARFGRAEKPRLIPEKQAFAAYGQPLLMREYISALGRYGLEAAQILLTHPDLADRNRFLNAKQALGALLARGIVPVINENDSVAIDEIKFGDNDRLSACVANLAEADLLVILSHVDGLYTADPAGDPKAEVIPVVDGVDERVTELVFANRNAKGTGGMATKIEAARMCMDFGIPVFVTNGGKRDCVRKIWTGGAVGTLFKPSLNPVSARKHWIGRVLVPKGTLIVDEGARAAIMDKKRSLLPSGVKAVEGRFEHGDCVEVKDPSGRLIAKGLVSYSAEELGKIKGCKSAEIQGVLGYEVADEAIHRDDLVVEKG